MDVEDLEDLQKLACAEAEVDRAIAMCTVLEMEYDRIQKKCRCIRRALEEA